MDRRKISVPVTESLYEKIEELAGTLNRPLAVSAGRLIALSLDREGKKSFTKWLFKRLNAKSRKIKNVSFRQTASERSMRIQLLLEADLIEELEEMADRMNHRPVNLAALLMDHSIDAWEWWIKAARSPAIAPLLYLAGIRPDNESVDLRDFPEHRIGPWMDKVEQCPGSKAA